MIGFARDTSSKDRLFRVVVSIHDVTPATLPQARQILQFLADHGSPCCTLLVVPDAQWSGSELETLRRWQDSGHELAAHGWRHHCPRIASWGHCLHSLVLSRNLAEHLSFGPEEIVRLVERSHDWFEEAGLAAPRLYVPPAWAMGRVARPVLRELPFERIELLTGLYDCRADRFTRLPLVGYEADNRWRQLALRGVNFVNRLAAGVLGRPLRIAIHPFDFDHFLAKDLKTLLERPVRFLQYSDVAS